MTAMPAPPGGVPIQSLVTLTPPEAQPSLRPRALATTNVMSTHPRTELARTEYRDLPSRNVPLATVFPAGQT